MNSAHTDRPPAIQDLVHASIESIEAMYKQSKRPGQPSGLSTGFQRLDARTDGLHPGELIVIAGRPDMGKTSLAMNIAEHVALEQGVPVSIFTLQMGAQKLMQRLICSRARVDLQSVSNGFLKEGDTQSLLKAAASYMQSKMSIDDTAPIAIGDLLVKVRRLRANDPVGLIVIDRFDLMGSPLESGAKRRQELAEIAAGIKTLAQEQDLPVIVTAELNDESEKRATGAPHLSDLGKSAAIGYCADVVALLFRHGYYVENFGTRDESDAELIIAKHPRCFRSRIPLTFRSEYTRFEDRDPLVRLVSSR